jgi:diguanylate cyclase (GGDEF)-like protein
MPALSLTRSLQLRPHVFVVATTLVTAILFSIVLVPQYFSKQARLEMLRANVSQVARLAASVVVGDLHAKLIQPDQHSPALYAEALAPLVKLHLAIPELSYLYTMVEKNHRTYFVLDTANSDQIKSGRATKPSQYMDEFKIRPEYNNDWLDQIAAGVAWVTPTFQQDDFGDFLTGHAAIRDSSGKYVGFVGVDYNLQYYLQQEADFKRITVWSLVAAQLMAVAMGFFVARYEFTLHRQVQSHYHTSVRDQLTNLFNRRGALQAVGESLLRNRKGPHATLIVDIDDFKLINDGYGHQTGDDIISRLAVAIEKSLRAHDICARLGGDEFMIFAPNCDISGAREIADRLLAAIAEDNRKQAVPFTVSIGISVEIHASASFDGLYRLADAALYQAKSEGKNRFAVYIKDSA